MLSLILICSNSTCLMSPLHSSTVQLQFDARIWHFCSSILIRRENFMAISVYNAFWELNFCILNTSSILVKVFNFSGAKRALKGILKLLQVFYSHFTVFLDKLRLPPHVYNRLQNCNICSSTKWLFNAVAFFCYKNAYTEWTFGVRLRPAKSLVCPRVGGCETWDKLATLSPLFSLAIVQFAVILGCICYFPTHPLSISVESQIILIN